MISVWKDLVENFTVVVVAVVVAAVVVVAVVVVDSATGATGDTVE